MRIGVDGGGSSTEAVLAESTDASTWRELGRGRASGCNRDGRIDVEPIRLAIEKAFMVAQRPVQPVAHAVLALAGAGRESAAREVSDWAAANRLARAVEVVTDIAPLLSVGGASTIALIAGTGAMAASHGNRAGGLGPLLGDEGSGYWLAMEALKRAAATVDGRGEAYRLQQEIQALMGWSEPSELPRLVARAKRDELARFAPVVLQVWQDGDADASVVVESGAEHLAELVSAVLRKDSLESFSDLVLAGSLLVKHQPYRQALIERLRSRRILPKHVHLVSDPAAVAAGIVESVETSRGNELN